MKTRSQKLTSLLLALVMVLSLLPATALAEDVSYDADGFSTGGDSVTYQPATQVTADNCAALGLTESYVGYYAIGNAGQLYWFAGLVNGDAGVCVGGVTKNTAANAVLTADITVNTGVLNADGALAPDTSTFKAWTPIGDTSYTDLDQDNTVDDSNAYAGTFDGQNHTISGLYLNNAEGKNDCALFGMTTSDAQISNLTVADSYFGGRNRVAGVCARNNGRITNCTNRSAVSSSVKTAGGICGWNDRGTITGCTNSGTISGPKYIGGVCGYNDGTISGCTNSGNVTGTGNYTGGVCGFNASIGKTENCRNEGTVTGSQYTGGVCGYNNKIGDNIGTITGCTNSGAVTGNYTGGVCGYSNGTITNCTNTNSGTVSGKHFTGGVSGYNIGSITGCANSGTVNGTNNTGGVCGRNYNTGTITNCTNSGTVTSTGNSGTDAYGRTAGVAGYNTGTITGCSNTGTIKATADCTGGVCGYNNSTTSSKGTITNCTNSGAVTGTGQYTGGVCGYNADTMTNCTNTNTGTVTGTDDYTGGVCGFNASTGKIENCRNEGTVSGKNFTGGVSGYNNSINANKGTITNCTNSGDVSSSSSIVGGVCGRNYGGSITNCYFNSDAYLGNAVGSTDNNGTDTAVEGKTAAQFRSGEVAWLLNGSTSDGDLAWGQTIGTDPYPVLGGEKVYKTTPCVTYSNTSGTKEHDYVNGICADCGAVQEGITNYVISNQDHLNAFVAAVNSGNVSINAQLSVNGLTLTTPIGRDADGKRYTGVFDGGNHTLTVTLSGGDNTAPFAAIENATIKNLRTTGTIQTGGKYAAGLVSNAWHTVTIENCYSDVIITSTVNGDGTHGGLVGRSNHDSDDIPGNPANITIRNCGFAGQINGENTTSCGGLMGWIHQGQTLTVKNCYVAGTFTVAGTKSDTICRNIEHAQVTATVTNFYYLTKLGGFGGGKPTLQANCTQLTAAQFASGEAAWLLRGGEEDNGSAWGQTIGTDGYPVPNGETVYRLNALRCDGQVLDTYVFSNSETAVLTHTLENVAEVPATYESDGVKAHQHCTTCDKNFIDGVEQSAEDLRIPKLVMPIIPVTPTYPPTVSQPAEGGSVTVSTNNPAQGSTVTVTPKPEDGYEVAGITITDKNGAPVAVTDNGDGTYSFTQPAGAVTVSVTFAEKAQRSFVDVKPGTYYYDAVQWAVANGITDGTGDGTTFSPNANCTRGQIVTFLWRAAGCPAPKSSENPFTDVNPDAYYYEAMLWAVENGITDGTGDGTTFSPDAACTRDQAVTFLWRAAGQPAAVDGTAFADVPAGAYYAPAVQWAVTSGITDGTGDGTTFSPADDCTRGQIVTFLWRYLGK